MKKLLFVATMALALSTGHVFAAGGGPGRGHGDGSHRAAGLSLSQYVAYVQYYRSRQDGRALEIYRSLRLMAPGGRARLSAGRASMCGGCTAPSTYDYDRN